MPVDTELQFAPSYPSLDIVEDCADLSGRFPANVALKFIYSNHGSPTDDRRDAVLGPYLRDAEVIALELAGSDHSNPKEDTEREFEIVNRIVSGELSGSWAETYGDLPPTILINRVNAILRGRYAAGSTERPRFLPFDTYHTPVSDHIARRPPEGFLETAIADANYLRQRESTTVRQLHSYAWELAASTEGGEIAVVGGAKHSFTSVAARQLGAKVSRVTVDKYPFNPTWYLTRLIRLGASDQVISQEAQIAETANNFGFQVDRLVKELDIEDPNASAFRPTQIGMTHLRYQKGLLLPKERAQFADLLPVIEPYLVPDRSLLHFGRKKELRKAITTIISQSSRLAA